MTGHQQEVAGGVLHLSDVRKQRDETPGMDGLPVIDTASERPARYIVKDSLAALHATNDTAEHPVVFVRGAHLVRVSRSNAGVVIEPVKFDALRGLLTTVANFVREGHHKWPPKEVVQTILAMEPEAWGFPPLEGVVGTPVLRHDGTLLTDPGYDPETALFYLPDAGLEVPEVSDVPTSDEVARALDVLDDVLHDFPFKEDGYANTIGAFLTPVVRRMIGGQVPLWIIKATKRRTGKNLLGKVVGRALFGAAFGARTPPESEAEWRKEILSILIKARPVVLIDEVEELKSRALTLLLTSPNFSGRLLGTNDDAEYPHRTFWIVTGNNVQLRGDLGERVFRSAMDAETSRPGQRTNFRYRGEAKLLARVDAQRPHLVWALLTLARSWVAAGRPVPKDLFTFGGYEEWTETIGGILAHAGIDGFLSGMGALHDEADTESVEWERFLRIWRDEFGGAAVKTGDVVARLLDAEGTSNLRETLPTDLAPKLGSPGLGVAVGKALTKRRGTRYGGDDLRLELVGEDSRSNVKQWRLAWEPVHDEVAGADDADAPETGAAERDPDAGWQAVLGGPA
jgi:hypothetical protein